jgi:hypothetical protein
VLGSLAFSILCAHTRYAQVNPLRFDAVNPAMLGMKKVYPWQRQSAALKHGNRHSQNVIFPATFPHLHS